MSKRKLAFSLAFVCLISLQQGASAIVINWTDEATSGFDANKVAVIKDAIGEWETAITKFNNTEVANRNTFTISITQIPTDPGYASTSNFMQDANGIPLSAKIVVDSGDTTDATTWAWFVDLTPSESSEYVKANGSKYHGKAKAAGGTGGNATGKVDLLEVMKHELAHALGFTRFYTKFAAAENPANTLNYAPGQTAKLVAGITHLDPALYPDDLMANVAPAVIEAGDRWLPSPLDLDILAGVFGYTVNKSALREIPVPGTLLLVVFGAAMLAAGRRARPITPLGAALFARTA